MINHKPFITVSNGISGWKAVLMMWDEEGFYEPWDTGFGRHSNRADAVKEAVQWAKDAGLEYQDK